MPLIQCSFPHADPGEAHSFTRKNGWLELTLGTTRPETGLPYGVPARLLTIYAASEAVRTKSPEIFLGNSVHDFLRRLDVPITRGDRGSLRVYANQLLKLIHCTLTIDENISDASGRTGLHIRQALFAEEARLWWDDETRGVGQGSSLVLSSVLFHSILDRSAPLSTNAIKQLRKSPMDLDVYAWLVHRLFSLSKPSTVTWQQLSEQFGHGYSELRRFRRFFTDSLKRVQTVYPEAKLKVADSRRDPAALATAPRADPDRCHQALNPQGVTRSIRVTAAILPSCAMRSPSWFRLERSRSHWPCTFARRSRQASIEFRDETSPHQPLATEQGRSNQARQPLHLSRLNRANARTTRENLAKYSNLLETPEAPLRRPLHLSRFFFKLLIYMH